MTQQNVCKRLKAYFEKREDVVMAFLFGSRAKNRVGPLSDWDVAVYLKTDSGRVEWEERNKEYPEMNKIWGDVMDILKTDNVDLIILNQAPSSIANTAISGKPLIVKDRKLYLEFMLIVSREAEDYRQFVDEYAKVFWRSASLAPPDRERLKKSLSFLGQQMLLYKDFTGLSLKEYEEDHHKRNDVERWIENIMNASIDIAKLVLGSQKKPIPSTYRDALRNAAWALGFSEDFGLKLEQWAKLRNILAHEYLDIRWKQINEFIHKSEDMFQKFIESVKTFLEV